MKTSPKPFADRLRASSPKARGCFFLFMIVALVFFLPVNQTFAQSTQAEIEFWQTVKNSPDPLELQAYLDIYPQGKFAPLARIRIRKLANVSGTQPVDQTRDSLIEPPQGEFIEQPQSIEPSRIEPVAPAQAPVPPPVEIPVFRAEDTNVTDAMCRQRLGPQGVAASDFGGTASICLCRPPFEISSDGTFCVRAEGTVAPPRIVVPPQPQARRPVAKPRPAKIKRRRPPPAVKRKPRSRNYPKRPPRAQARAIANRYCRQRYGKNLRNVVVKKSKFYCNYSLDGGSNIAVKRKKFKDISR